MDGSSREARGPTAREASGLLRKGRSSERLSWREKKSASASAPAPCVPAAPAAVRSQLREIRATDSSVPPQIWR